MQREAAVLERAATQPRFTRRQPHAYSVRIVVSPSESAPDAPMAMPADAATDVVEDARLKVGILGPFSLAYRGQPIALVSRKAQAIIGCLILSGAFRLSRQDVTSLLWSAVDESRANGALRTALWELQKVLREAHFKHFTAERLAVQLASSEIDVDLFAVHAEAVAGRVHPLLLERRQLSASILQGLDHVDTALATWLLEQRASWQERLIKALLPHLPPESAAVISPQAEAVARAILSLDAAQETAVRCLMRARAKAGDMAAMLSIYTSLWQLMEREYDTQPSIETQNLCAELRLAEPEGDVTPESLAKAFAAPTSGYDARPSIAVLPFRTLGPSEESYFGEGVVDNIINALGGLKDLFVISRGSTLQYKGADLDIKQIGRDLGVRYLLTGKAQRAGNTLRITTELVETETAEVLKPKRYEGRLPDLFKLQDEIALETTKFIAPYVRERELKRALRKHPNDMNAYELVLQALGPLHDLEYTSFSRARQLLHKAAELDPTYGLAFSLAAQWHCYRVGQEWSTDVKADCAEAERLSSIAISLDETDATALAVHAHVSCLSRKDYGVSRAQFERSLATCPNSSFSWTLSSITESCAGDGPRAVAHALAAKKLSPSDGFAHYARAALAQAHFVCGSWDAAVANGLQAYALNDRFSGNMRVLAASLIEVGRREDARDIVDRHCKLVPGFTLAAWLKRTHLASPAKERVARNLRLAGMP